MAKHNGHTGAAGDQTAPQNEAGTAADTRTPAIEPQAARDARENRHKYFMNIAIAVRCGPTAKATASARWSSSIIGSSPPGITALQRTW